jgi:hypothetical protein
VIRILEISLIVLFISACKEKPDRVYSSQLVVKFAIMEIDTVYNIARIGFTLDPFLSTPSHINSCGNILCSEYIQTGLRSRFSRDFREVNRCCDSSWVELDGRIFILSPVSPDFDSLSFAVNYRVGNQMSEDFLTIRRAELFSIKRTTSYPDRPKPMRWLFELSN